MFKSSDILGLRSDWMIRRDQGYVLLYKLSTEESKTWILDPIETEQIFLGDILITRGAPLGIKEFKELAEAKLKKLEY